MKINAKRIKRFSIYRRHGEKGQALIIVLSLLLLVTLIASGVLTFVGVSLRTNKTYVNNTNQMYAAEAGIQDGIWQVLHKTTSDINGIKDFNPAGTNTDSVYDPFKYYCKNNPAFNKEWVYPLVDSSNNNPSTNYLFNGFPVTLNLKSSWVPLVDYNNPSPSYNPPNGIYTPPTLSQVNDIFAGNVVVSGHVTTIPIFNARITYLGLNTSGNSLPILSIGCWLPRGFSYNNGSSNFEQGTPVYSTETVLPCSGNVAVVWTFPAGTTLYSLQTDMGQSPGSQTLAVNFSYTTSLTKLPECLPWVVWGTDAGDFTWDADITVFDMTASAGNPGSGYIDIETFLPKSQTRMLGNALPGDYVATGGSNLTDLNGDGNRETYIPSSSSTVNVIPAGSMVEAAYLYWGGWVRGDADATLNPNVTNTNDIFYDASVNLESDAGGSQAVTIDTSNPDNVYWSDKVKSGRGGTISITNGSNIVNGQGTTFTSTSSSGGVQQGGNKRDQIAVQNTDGTFTWFIVQKVDSDTKLELKSAASGTWNNVPYYVFDGYYYGCKTDVTDFVRHYSQGVNLGADPQVFGTGDATYTVSNLYSDRYCVQDQDHPGGATEICTSAWAGWSLVIVYSNANTLGHQLYLFDNFQSIANTSGNNLTQISGFIVPYPVSGDTGADAVKLTAFVGEGDKGLTGDFFAIRVQSDQSTDKILWDGVTDDPNDTSPGNGDVSNTARDAFNSESINNASTSGGYLNASGVDIDTFHVKWSDNLVQTNDTTATLNMFTNTDGLVSIYIIASFRSSVTSGGSVSYLIRKRPPAP